MDIQEKSIFYVPIRLDIKKEANHAYKSLKELRLDVENALGHLLDKCTDTRLSPKTKLKIFETLFENEVNRNRLVALLSINYSERDNEDFEINEHNILDTEYL